LTRDSFHFFSPQIQWNPIYRVQFAAQYTTMPKPVITRASKVGELPGLTANQASALRRAKLSTVGALVDRVAAKGPFVSCPADSVAGKSAKKSGTRFKIPAIALAYAQHMPKARHTYANARALAKRICDAVHRMTPGAPLCCPVGSLRRGDQSIGDLDLMTSVRPKKIPVEKIFESLGGKVLAEFASGENRRQFIVRLGAKAGSRGAAFPLDFFYGGPAKDWGSALVHFTGNKVFNIRLRAHARRKGFTLSQYGAQRLSDGKRFHFKEERPLFKFFGFRWHEPTERTKTMARK
jgi:hypothetical protein